MSKSKSKRLLIGATYKPAESSESKTVTKPKSRTKKKEEPEEEPIEEDYNLVRLALQKTAEEVFPDGAIPSKIKELVNELTLNDQDVLWEFASISEDGHKIETFYDNIRDALTQRRITLRALDLDPDEIPSYLSLVFESPLLVEERKYDEEADSQLLRKDTPVRGIAKCPKCTDQRISTRIVQIRSFDEPANAIKTCYACGHSWIE
jgi:DNA-directed RNA polymerase subunit M/transcription elongation factor TFIIS